MHTDQEVLAALLTQLDQDQLAAVLDRVLRVPEAWAALHNPAFLDEVVTANPPAHLTPSHLASLALGGSLHSEMRSSLAEAHAERARQAWEEASVGVVVQRDLFDAALLGAEFGRRYDGDPEGLLERVADSPSTWRSPIAIAWPNLKHPENLLGSLLDRNLYQFAIQIALANYPAGEAATFLTRNANGSTVQMLQQITRGGESALARSLELSADGSTDKLSQLLIEAVTHQFKGKHNAARSSLQQAWETASETTAQVADFTADQARETGDHVTELEANRRALEILPTPARRARTALSLLSLDRPGEAISLVSGSDPSVEERIAGGLAQSQSRDTCAQLNSVLASLDDSLDEQWFAVLTEGLVGAEDWAAAVEAAQTHVAHHPSSMEAHVSLAHLLLEAGDPEAADGHAAIGLALNPHSEKALRLQAEIQQRMGHHAKALEYWRRLPAVNAVDLAEYAIAADEFEFAGSVMNEMSTGPREVVLKGMLLDSSGDREGAIAKYREAIRKTPSEIQAYVSLAAAQIDGGEHSKAYDTLTEAMQANPMDPSVRLSLSRYLRGQGKTSEALEVASVAWELDEKSVPTGLEYADLLSELGHVDRALEILRQAALRQPLSWQVGLALAKAYERRGDISQADRVIRPLPPSAPPEAYFHSARISLKADIEAGSALQYLELAENGGWSDPSLDYWFGRAFEREENYEEALARYDRAQNSSDYEIREQAVLGSARAALGLDQISRALAALEQAQGQFPRSARILAAMSDVYLVANLPDKALEVAEHAVELEPDETRAWHALGDSLANAGDFRGAVKAIERLSALDPAAAEGWLTLARLASRAQDQRVVRRSVAEALWRGRRNPNVLKDVAQFLEQTGNLRTAVRVMKAATRARPEDARMLGALAMIQESAEDYQGAYETWQSSIALSPSEAEPLRRSAACAQELGLGGPSVKLLEKAVAIEPGNPWLRRDLAIAHLEQGQVRQGLLAYAAAVKSAPNDSSLAYEAAEAALCSGDPRYALALLGKTGSALANSGRAQAAMGEAFLLLDKRDQAVSSLSDAVEQGYETTRTFSMLAITAPDRGRAVEYLAQARSIPIESAHDAIWLARAEAELFNASEAMEALKPWAADPFAAQEQVRVSLRSRDTLWLFGLSDAVSALREDALTSHAQSALEDLQERNLADPALGAWLRIEAAPSDLGEYIDADPMGWIGEALAVAHIKADQMEAAREALDQVRLVRSESTWSSVLEGMIHEASGRQEDARAAYRSGSSSSPVASFLLGRAYERSGSLERAATHMGAAVVEAPDQHRWQHKLASVYLEMGDEDSALAHLQEAVARDPENPEYLLSLAATYAVSGHLNQALEGYTAALAYGSESAAAHREAGQVALQLGALDQASAWFERAITLSPSDIDSLIGSAKASIARGDKQQANERLGSAIQQAPGDARVLLGMGHVRAESGDHRAAMSAFEEALQAGADPSDVRRGESKVLVEQGKHAQAAEVMQEVLNSAPDDHRLWHELAETLEAGSDLGGADRAISEAVRISPANPEYRLSLGRISRKSGNLDRAIEELRQAEGADPEDSRVPIEAGLVYEDRRDYSRALDSYLKAVEIDPNSLQAHYRAGLLLRTLKAYRKAGEMLKRAAELAPTDQGVMHQLAAVRALELVHG
ncbi:MAG: tetratricopeptide repeat protein [Anaerolineales bacterium]